MKKKTEEEEKIVEIKSTFTCGVWKVNCPHNCSRNPAVAGVVAVVVVIVVVAIGTIW